MSNHIKFVAHFISNISIHVFVFQHAMECGYGTAIFLILMSSSVFVIRGDKASVWGSVYLDEFGEEDIDLRSEFYLIHC
jgi:hypothetical protein